MLLYCLQPIEKKVLSPYIAVDLWALGLMVVEGLLSGVAV